MNARYPFALALIVLAAAAAPSQAQQFSFATADEQLLEVIEEFDFAEVAPHEDSDTTVGYQLRTDEYVLHVVANSDGHVAIYAFWDNSRGVRRGTLETVNEWNRFSWSTHAYLDETGSYVLLATPPVEMELTVDELIDMMDTFLMDMDSFAAHIAS